VLVSSIMLNATLSAQTVRSSVIARALLDRDLDPLAFEAPDRVLREGALRSMYVAALGGDFDDDDPRWRRRRRGRPARFRA
jgi:hypothetical protein